MPTGPDVGEQQGEAGCGQGLCREDRVSHAGEHAEPREFTKALALYRAHGDEPRCVSIRARLCRDGHVTSDISVERLVFVDQTKAEEPRGGKEWVSTCKT